MPYGHFVMKQLILISISCFRGETIPEKSKYKLSPSCIELILTKAENKRWGDLEALKRKGESL